jgi:hypothetical protein
VIQAESEVAVHAHPFGAATESEPDPPDAASEADAALSATSQDGTVVAPGWSIFTDCPATLTVPVRAPALLPATCSVVDPAPVALEPAATEIQASALCAVHAQPDAVCT